MAQAYQQELDEFLKGKGLLGEAPPTLTPPPAQDLQKDLDDFLWNKGITERGGLRRETLETEFKPPVTGQEAVEDYMEEPGFWQQVRDLSALASVKDPHMFSIAAEAALSGVSFRNQERIVNLVGKVTGKPDLYNTFKEWQQKGLKKKLGYIPSPEVTAFVEAPTEVATTLVPLSGIFRGAGLAAKGLTKIPFLRALARAEIAGTVTGLLRKPEDEGLLNRLKQVPGDVGFFTLFEIGALGATQGYKMYRWTKEFKGKPPKWAGSFSEYTPPAIGAREAEVVMSKEEFKELLRKITTRPSGPQGGEAFEQFISSLSAKEKDVFTAFSGKQTWSDVWGRVKQEGILREVVDIPGRQPPPVPVFEAQRVPIPRQPKFPDIFKQVDKFGRPLGAPEFEPFPEEPLRPPGAEPPPPRPTAPPPPTEAPPPISGAPPEAPLRPTEAPRAFEAAPPQAGPLATVDVIPTAEGGWTIKIPQPVPKPVPGGLQPGPTIPWKPFKPEALPLGKEPPKAKKVIKPRKPPTYKNPFYEAINQQGGVAPNPDYPYSELRQLFPIALIKKTGMEMDVLAQAMRHEFPTIEGDTDLWNMADDIRRGSATFRDERTGDEHLPPREEIEAQAQRFVDRKPEQMTYADFNRQIKVAIKDIKTGDVHKGKPEESIHAQMFTRIQNKGIKAEDMEAGFVLPNGQFIFSYGLKPTPKGEPTPGPKYDRDVFHRELVKKAIDEGKYISPEVLAQHKIDYPELFKKPVVFEPGDTVEFDSPTGPRTGEITAINEKEGLATIKTKEGTISTREFENIKLSEKPPAVVPKEVPRVAEEKPPAVAEEPTLTEIEKTFDEMAISRIKRGVLADQIIRNYKPEKGPLKTYIKSILGKITEEGELRVRPTIKRAVRPERLTPQMEEVVPGKGERPEDILERAEEEGRVQKIFKEATKTDRERDILDRKILQGQSYEDIGKAHGITRQRAEQIFKESFEKVKDHPDVKAMIERKMRQANLGPIPSEQDLKDLGRLVKKYFFSSKGVDKVIDSAGDKRIQSILAEIFDATPEAKIVKSFLRKNNNPALDALVLDTIKGEIPAGGTALPSEIKDAIRTMRERMDKLSLLIMANGGLTEQTKAVFDARLGSYIGKFYRLHQQRRWDPPREVKDRFKSMLQRNYPERFGQFTEEELNNFVEGIINEERKFGFGVKKAKRVPTGHFKKRVRLMQEWRDLAGEYLDPVWLYLKTINVQSTMAYNAEFLNKIKQTYPESWVTDTVEAEKRGWQKYRLPANYGYGELKNKYVHPELYKYITQEVDPSVSGMEKAIMKFITNPFKATKTIGSMPTQARNFFSNFPLTLLNQNFILNPANLPYYIRAFKVYMGRNAKLHKEWVKLIKEGVTGVEFYGTDIPKVQETLMKLDPLDWGDKILEMALAPAKFGIRKLGSLYNLNDALFRIATFYKRTEHFGETPQQAVEELNRSLQNYRKLPIVADVMRKYTVFGPFISFRWNVAKIMTNQAVQAGKEMAKKGTKMKGSLRLARLLFFLGLPSLISKISKEVFDVDGEQVKRFEDFLPRYRKHGVFAYFRGKEGQLKAFDLTFIYPTGEVQRAAKALRKGDIETFVDAIDLFAHPIFDAWSILIEGRQPYWGTKVEGGFLGRMTEIIKMLWIPASAPIPSVKSLTESMKAGKFEPRAGALTGHQMKAMIDAWNQEPDKYGRVRNLSEEVKTFFTGLKTWNVEPDKLLMQSIRAMRSEASTLKWELQGWLVNNPKAPAWEIKDRTDDYNKRATKLLEKAGEAMKLYKELKEGGFLVKKEK